MATKKKELLEQENTAPETTVPVENAPPPDEAQADMAAPADGSDLNELLASMDQPDEEAATIEDDGSLPELTESETPLRMTAASRNSPKARCLVRWTPMLRWQTPFPAMMTPL